MINPDDFVVVQKDQNVLVILESLLLIVAGESRKKEVKVEVARVMTLVVTEQHYP